MSNTSVHLPGNLLQQLDELASRRGVSRNRLIVESCHELVRQSQGWPEGFFDPQRYDPEDLELLRSGQEDFDVAISESRRSRRRAPF